MDGEMRANANDAPVSEAEGLENTIFYGDSISDHLLTSPFFCFQTTNTGGGSAGSIWIKADLFEGRGYMYVNGGTSSGSGGGGAGGRINIFYRTGDFLTGHIQSKGMKQLPSSPILSPCHLERWNFKTVFLFARRC